MSSSDDSAALGSRDALRRMVAGHEAAAKVARRVEAAELPTPEAAFDAAAELWGLCADVLAQPRDLVRQKDDEMARRAWAQLHAVYGR